MSVTLTASQNGIATALRGLCLELSRNDEWDQPPSLAVVEQTGDLTVVMALDTPDVWDRYDAHRVIRVLAAANTVVPRWRRNAATAAVVFVGESWTGEIPEGTPPDEAREFYRWCQSHSVADHPWGREARTLMAVGFDHTVYLAEHIRGKPDAKVTVVPEAATRTDGVAIGGRIIVALTELLDSFDLAVEGGDRG